MLSLMKLQLLDLTKARLSFVAKAGNLTNFFNYLQSAILLIIMLSFWFRVHLARQHAVEQETHPIEKRKKRATLLTSSRLLQWGGVCVLFIFTAQLYWDKWPLNRLAYPKPSLYIWMTRTKFISLSNK